MKRLILILTPCLVLWFLAGCASLGMIQGSVQDNHYTSPSGSFRVQIPLRGRIRDGASTPEGWQVKFWDDFCRMYYISEDPSDLKGLSIETWVDQIIIPTQKDLKASLLERKTLQTQYGPAVFLRYRLPEAAPCITVQFKEGKQIRTTPDTEQGEYIFYKDGYFYSFIYALGVDSEGKAMTGLYGTSEIEKELTRFLEGFEILRTTQK